MEPATRRSPSLCTAFHSSLGNPDPILRCDDARCAHSRRRERGAQKCDLARPGGAIQVSRAVGWRKLVPLLAVGILAAGVGMELFGRDKPEVESDEQNGDRELARAA